MYQRLSHVSALCATGCFFSESVEVWKLLLNVLDLQVLQVLVLVLVLVTAMLLQWTHTQRYTQVTAVLFLL